MEGLSPSPEVVVLGCAGVDTNVFLPGREVDWSVEANFTENLDTPGQAGVYASRGYAALGRRVAFIGNLVAFVAQSHLGQGGELFRRQPHLLEEAAFSGGREQQGHVFHRRTGGEPPEDGHAEGGA